MAGPDPHRRSHTWAWVRKHVVLSPDGHGLGPAPYTIEDNDDSFLDATDVAGIYRRRIDRLQQAGSRRRLRAILRRGAGRNVVLRLHLSICNPQ